MMMRSSKTNGANRVPKVGAFEGCTKTELASIASLTTECYVEPGRALTRSGERGMEFFIVIEGTATVSRGDTVLAKFGPGDFFGEVALLDGCPRTATVVADSPMRLLVSSRQEFSSMRDLVPGLNTNIIREAQNRARNTLAVLDKELEYSAA
jgi:CRP-like cAMP-binding protein